MFKWSNDYSRLKLPAPTGRNQQLLEKIMIAEIGYLNRIIIPNAYFGNCQTLFHALT